MHVTTRGFNLHTIGMILMIVGIAGLVISVLWMTIWADRRRRVVAYDDGTAPADRPRRVAYDDGAVPPARRVP